MPIKLMTTEGETTWNQRFQDKLGTDGEVLMDKTIYILEKIKSWKVHGVVKIH
jgi:hypothetical protein